MSLSTKILELESIIDNIKNPDELKELMKFMKKGPLIQHKLIKIKYASTEKAYSSVMGKGWKSSSHNRAPYPRKIVNIEKLSLEHEFSLEKEKDIFVLSFISENGSNIAMLQPSFSKHIYEQVIVHISALEMSIDLAMLFLINVTEDNFENIIKFFTSLKEEYLNNKQYSYRLSEKGENALRKHIEVCSSYALLDNETK